MRAIMRMGIDLGGTKIEGVVLDSGGSAVLRRRISTPTRGGYEAIVGEIVTLVMGLEAEVGAPCSVGIGTPGSISTPTGGMKNSNSVSLNGNPLLADLERRLERNIRMANDANCFALSEALLGAGKSHGVVFGVILGTGVGGGFAIDGVVHGGRHGIAGEWGHNCLRPDGWACYCGRRGCVEAYLCGAGLVRRYHEAGGVEAATGRDVAEANLLGDSYAARALDLYVADLGRALAFVLNVIDPHVVVLGGGLSNIERLYRDVPQAILPYLFNDELQTPLLKNRHGDSSGVLGAALLWS